MNRGPGEGAKLRLGTRGSKLALIQADTVRAAIGRLDPTLEVEIVPIKTSGDRGDRDRLGAFVREIQDELLRGGVDVGLHCLKDLPTTPVPGLTFAAHLEREDPRDAILTRGAHFERMSTDAVVGTGSVRRTAQLRARWIEWRFLPLIGNVDTRLRRLQEGEYEAIVLAMAGLRRLGLLTGEEESLVGYEGFRAMALEPEEMLPAAGQAVLVLETRDEGPARDLLSRLNHPLTQSCAVAERAFLKAFGGGCSVPVGALAEEQSGILHLEGLVASPDGSRVLRGAEIGDMDEAEEIGQSLAERLGEEGAFELFERVASGPGGTA